MAESTRFPDEQPPRADGHTRSEISGSADNVLQARDVSGGVHFHASGSGSASASGPRPQQLPGDIRAFVNRVAELAHLDAVLSGNGAPDGNATIVIITGTAGVGKTSLAVRWAHRVRGRFPDGQLYVNMRGYDPGEPVTALDALDRFLRSLDVPSSRIPADEQSRSALFRSLMADRRMLVVLDNAATVNQVRPLLPGNDGCLVLVSSRNRLSGLVARDGAERVTVETFSEAESIALLRKVTAAYRRFDESGDLAHLARLCAHLPLALRIAAERAAARPYMLLSDLIADLQDESALWDALSAEDDDAAAAVRTVFAWSYRALTADSARLFRLLGLHPGPEFSAAAAAALVAIEPSRVRRLLDGLVGVHLLEQVGHSRYQFHDLLHAYATDQAHNEEPPQQQAAALERVLTWYLHTADAAARTGFTTDALPPIRLDAPDAALSPMTFTDHGAAIAWYDTEHSNLITATRAAAKASLDTLAWKIPGVLRVIHTTRDPIGTWLEAEKIALAAARRAGDTRGEAVTLLGLGISHRHLRNNAEAVQCYGAAGTIFRSIDDPVGQMQAANGLGLVLLQRRELDQARGAFEQYVAAARRHGSGVAIGTALINLGQTFGHLGELDTAQSCLAEAAQRLHDCGAPLYECEALTDLASVLSRQGSSQRAREVVQQALSLAHNYDNPMSEAFALLDLARIELADAQPGPALVAAQQAATIFRKREDRHGEAACWSVIGEAHRSQGAFDESIAFHRQAADAHRALGDLYQCGVNKDRLAQVLLQTGKPSQARSQWIASLEAISDFTDPEASALRVRITLAMDAIRQE